MKEKLKYWQDENSHTQKNGFKDSQNKVFQEKGTKGTLVLGIVEISWIHEEEGSLGEFHMHRAYWNQEGHNEYT